MPASSPDPQLILLAKRPGPGLVKTRLMPELSAEEAAGVATWLIIRTVQLATGAWPGPVHLLCWPDPDYEVFREIAANTRIQPGLQSAGDLGNKMSNALCRATAGGTPAAVMGCDVPHCPPDQLRLAADLLTQGHDVIGPATDGGYYFIGLQACRPGLFTGVSWGGPDVYRTTVATAARLGMEFIALDKLRDIDDHEDLEAVSDQLPIPESWLHQETW